MRVLTGRGLGGGDFLRQVAAAQAQFLVRLAAARPPVPACPTGRSPGWPAG
jgi:hypothetical protein